ncbi:hypothetical protein GOODEAATRI_031319, partial [Goodea atripinnis]
ESSGEILNNNCVMEYHQTTGTLSAHFRNMVSGALLSKWEDNFVNMDLPQSEKNVILVVHLKAVKTTQPPLPCFLFYVYK